MKTIRRVAGTELRTLFYSPIAWFVLVVFVVQSGIVFFNVLENTATQQEMGGIRLKYIMDLMGRVFNGKRGLFSTIMQNLYLFIPLLTMGLISRETSSGTIKLLYSSPIKVSDIILGKYLAMILYSLLLLAIVALFVFVGMNNVQDVDKGTMMTSLVGFYLLLCAYSAIGLFMSCLTTYQIVAAVCTFVMIAFLGYVGTIWQSIEFLRDITYFLSISGRTEKMLRGYLTTKDVLYYVVIIYIFLSLSILKLRSGMESKPALVKAARYVATIAIGLFAGYLSSRPAFIGYYDATSNQQNTVHPNVQKVMADLGEDPIEVTAYSNLLGGMSSIGMDNFHNTLLSTWEHYTRFKKGHNINVHKTITFYDSTLDNNNMMMGYEGKSLKQIAQQQAKANGISMKNVKTPGEMRRILDLRPELNRFVMQLKYKDRTTFLRVYDDNNVWPNETEVAAAFKRLLMAKLPKVAFLTGNMERSIFKNTEREYQNLSTAKPSRFALINQGFDVDTLTLETQDVPADVSILVIADPKQEYSEASLIRLKQYIANGGNLLIACEPSKNSPLLPLLKELGVQLMQGQVIQEDKDFAPNQVRPNITPFAAGLSKYLENVRTDTTMEQPVAMYGVAGLTWSSDGPFKVDPLLTSDPKLTWNRIKDVDLELTTSAVAENMPGNVAIGTTVAAGPSAGRPNFNGTISFAPQDGDVKGPITTAISLTRKVGGKEQRVVVTGDADFMRNNSWSQTNFLLSTALFRWLSYNAFPIDSYRPARNDTRLTVTSNQVSVEKTILLWGLPAALVAFASILLIRRKRK